MADIFKLPVDGKDMDFFCGTYAVEKTLEAMNISITDIQESLASKFIPTIRHFIYFSAMNAQKLKTAKGEALDFPYDTDDVYNWLDGWGGGNSANVTLFTSKLLSALFGTIQEEEPKADTKKKPKK